LSLYLDHFGLDEAPFRITPHPDFFYAGANRGPVLDALLHALGDEEGIIKVSGEVGSGKTMLCRMLLERLGDRVDSIYLANPSLSRREILVAIGDDLGLELPPEGTHGMTRALQKALLERHGAGRRVVLLIDEAHAMPAESLEEVRLLSNLESRHSKLLQIVLFGQPELDDRLARQDLRQLRERITQHFQLQPLPRADVAAYLEFRLRTAGYRGPNPFTPAATHLIAKASGGLTRRINILADKALLAAFSRNLHQVDRPQAQAAITDARFQPIQPQRVKQPLSKPLSKSLSWRKPLGLGLGTGGLLAALWAFGKSPGQQTPPPAPPASPAPHLTSAPPQEPAAAKPVPPSSGLPPRTAARLAAFEEWIPLADPTHFTLQLLVTDLGSSGDVEGFLERIPAGMDADTLRVYRAGPPGRERLGVIYGDYSSRTAANTALRQLPDSIRASGPYPRSISRLP